MNRKLKVLLILLATTMLLVATSGAAVADVGGFSGSSDFGGSSSGGSSGSSGDGDGIGELVKIIIYLLIWLIMDVPGGWIIALLIIAICIVVGGVALFRGAKDQKSGKNGKSGKSGGKRNRVVVEDTFDTSKLMDLGYYYDKDPGFDDKALCDKAAKLYVDMQHAWTAKDFEPMRPYYSDAMFSQLDSQLDSLRNRQQTNYVDDIAVLGVLIEGWYQENGQDCMALKIRTRIVDYTTDDNTGRLISGDKHARKFMTYRWIMTRTSGFTTQEEGAMQAVSCPNCAAELLVNKTSKCPYCGSIITVEEHDWVINAMMGLSQTTE